MRCFEAVSDRTGSLFSASGMSGERDRDRDRGRGREAERERERERQSDREGEEGMQKRNYGMQTSRGRRCCVQQRQNMLCVVRQFHGPFAFLINPTLPPPSLPFQGMQQ
jgi:hypothetical protein